MPPVKRKYDSTIARIAGNLLSGVPDDWLRVSRREDTVRTAVDTARLIVEEVERTEPNEEV